MTEKKINWNAHEFKVYLLLFAASADFELSDDEKKIILSKATKTEYLHIQKIFEKDTDLKRIETILSFHTQFFPTEKDADRLIKEIFKILNVDGELNIYEDNFLRIFKKILKI